MEKWARALLVVTALAILVSWTVWASEQVATGATVSISGPLVRSGVLSDAWGRK